MTTLIMHIISTTWGFIFEINFLRTGDTGPLEEAIRLGQLALDATPENHPNRAERLNNMGGHFQQRFLRMGDMKDLEEATRIGQLALDATCYIRRSPEPQLTPERPEHPFSRPTLKNWRFERLRRVHSSRTTSS